MSNLATLDFKDKVENWWDILTDEEQREVIESEYIRRFKIVVE